MFKKLFSLYTELNIMRKIRLGNIIQKAKEDKIEIALKQIAERQSLKEDYHAKYKIKKLCEVFVYCTMQSDDFDYYISRYVFEDVIYILTKNSLFTFELGDVTKYYSDMRTLKEIPLSDYIDIDGFTGSGTPYKGWITFLEHRINFKWMPSWKDLNIFLLKVRENALNCQGKRSDIEKRLSLEFN